VHNKGGPLTKSRGRKYSYSEHEFLEAYMGREYTKAVNLDDDEYS